MKLVCLFVITARWMVFCYK